MTSLPATQTVTLQLLCSHHSFTGERSPGSISLRLPDPEDRLPCGLGMWGLTYLVKSKWGGQPSSVLLVHSLDRVRRAVLHPVPRLPHLKQAPHGVLLCPILFSGNPGATARSWGLGHRKFPIKHFSVLFGRFLKVLRTILSQVYN